MSRPTTWNADQDKVIRKMAAAGKSGRTIAKALDRSPSSVVKRAKALGANLHGKSGPAKQIKPPVVKQAKVCIHAGNLANKRDSRQNDPEFKHVTPVVSVQPLMVSLVDLKPNQCKFPVGDPREEGFGFCGHPRADGVYCRPHAQLCYTAPELRRKAA